MDPKKKNINPQPVVRIESRPVREEGKTRWQRFVETLSALLKAPSTEASRYMEVDVLAKQAEAQAKLAEAAKLSAEAQKLRVESVKDFLEMVDGEIRPVAQQQAESIKLAMLFLVNPELKEQLEKTDALRTRLRVSHGLELYVREASDEREVENEARLPFRERKRERSVPVSPEFLESLRQEQERECDEEIQKLRACMARLPAEYLGPIYLHYFAGFSRAQISERLGIRKERINDLLRCGRELLRTWLDE